VPLRTEAGEVAGDGRLLAVRRLPADRLTVPRRELSFTATEGHHALILPAPGSGRPARDGCWWSWDQWCWWDGPGVRASV